MKTLLAPFGYKFAKTVDADDEAEILDLCLSLSDDPEYQEAVRKSSHKERISELKKNGFGVKAK